MHSVYLNGVLQSLDVQTKRMVGEVMNLMEGSLPETSATTALKKSIKQAMWRTNRNIQDDLNSMSFTNINVNMEKIKNG
tara:strand:- start:227 stop:463 length:237 start_codon:yes stop_codon:yes gene_type:complete